MTSIVEMLSTRESLQAGQFRASAFQRLASASRTLAKDFTLSFAEEVFSETAKGSSDDEIKLPFPIKQSPVAVSPTVSTPSP